MAGLSKAPSILPMLGVFLWKKGIKFFNASAESPVVCLSVPNINLGRLAAAAAASSATATRCLLIILSLWMGPVFDV